MKKAIASSEIETHLSSTLHLRLTFQDWVESFNTLTRAELGVFFAIRTLNPFGDRSLEIDCSDLGSQLGLHRTTVSRALESLSQKGLINLEITKARVTLIVSSKKLTLISKEKIETEENTSNLGGEEAREKCAPTHTEVRPRTQKCAHAHRSAPTHK